MNKNDEDLNKEGLNEEDQNEEQNLRNLLALISQTSAPKVPSNLSDAIVFRHIYYAVHFIIQGESVDTQGENDETLLHVLVDMLHSGREYELEEAELALSKNAAIPLTIQNDCIDIIDLIDFLQHRYHPRLLQDIGGNTPLHDAVRGPYENLDAIALRQLIGLLTIGQTSVAINIPNEQGVSAWFLSVLHNTLQCEILAEIPVIQINLELKKVFGYEHAYGIPKRIFVKVEKLWGMLDSGQNNGSFTRGWTDLMLLCLFENYRALDALLRFRQADLQLAPNSYVVSDGSVDLRELLPGDNPLHYAAANEDLQTFVWLLKRLGPEYLLRINSQGHTPLHKAAQVKNKPILRLLLNFEQLKQVLSHQWQLTEEFYTKFVNHDSQHGMAAHCYSIWMCTRRLRAAEDYQLFIDCPYYQITRCDRDGASLIHILAREGYAGLLMHAANTKRDARFDGLNGSGHTPLQVAVESNTQGTDEVINVLATLAYREHDINPNLTVRYYVNIRARLTDVMEEILYDSKVEGLTVEHLLNIYLNEESFQSHGYITYDVIQIKPIEIDGTPQPALTADIEECLSYLNTYFYPDTALNHFEFEALSSGADRIFDQVRKAYEKSFGKKARDEFTLTLEGETISVKIIKRDTSLRRKKVLLNYEVLASYMGEEWDYLKRLERHESDKNIHPRRFIFSVPQVPLIFLIIEQFSENKIDVESLAWKKFLALLNFPFIENLSILFDDELVSLSDYTVGIVKEKLVEKFKSQSADQATPLSLSPVTFDQITQLTANDLQKLRNGKEARGNDQERALYEFAKCLCERLRKINHSRRLNPHGVELYLLTALAELLEGDATCVAVLFTDRFMMSSNFSAKGGRTDLREVLSHLAGDVFAHLRQIVITRKIDVTQSVALLVKIGKEHLKSININKAASKVFAEHLDEFFSYIYAHFTEVERYLIMTEGGDLIKKKFADFLRSKFQAWLHALSDHHLAVLADEMCRLCYNLIILEQSILTDNQKRQMPLPMLDLLRNAKDISDVYQVIPNDSHVHAEIALIEAILERDNQCECSIGISKICCPSCTLLFIALNSLSCFQKSIYLYTSGSHNTHDMWRIPRLFFTNPVYLSAFLGGRNSRLCQIFEQLDAASKITAFHIIQDIYKITGKLEFKDLEQLLKREIYPHLRAPYFCHGYYPFADPQEELLLLYQKWSEGKQVNKEVVQLLLGDEEAQVQVAIENSLAEQEVVELIQKRKLAMKQWAAHGGYSAQDVAGDGNCFFYAVADQLKRLGRLGPDTDADTLRSITAVEIYEHMHRYRDFILEHERPSYADNVAKPKVWVGLIAAQAIARLKHVIVVIIPNDGGRPQVIKPKGATTVIVLGNEVDIHFQSLIPESGRVGIATPMIQRIIDETPALDSDRHPRVSLGTSDLTLFGERYLIEHRHDNPILQQEYDRRHGLIVRSEFEQQKFGSH